MAALCNSAGLCLGPESWMHAVSQGWTLLTYAFKQPGVFESLSSSGCLGSTGLRITWVSVGTVTRVWIPGLMLSTKPTSRPYLCLFLFFPKVTTCSSGASWFKLFPFFCCVWIHISNAYLKHMRHAFYSSLPKCIYFISELPNTNVKPFVYYQYSQ